MRRPPTPRCYLCNVKPASHIDEFGGARCETCALQVTARRYAHALVRRDAEFEAKEAREFARMLAFSWRFVNW